MNVSDGRINPGARDPCLHHFVTGCYSCHHHGSIFMSYLLFAALILGNIAGDPSRAVAEVSELSLRDQYGFEDSLAAHHGRVVVVMVVTAKRLRNIKPWESALRQQIEGVEYLRITDVPEETAAGHEQIADKLSERVPEGVSVLIDLERRWATALGLDTDRPNILLIDADGRLVETFRGKYNPDLAAAVIEELKKIQGAS
jgi:hypothetical protein